MLIMRMQSAKRVNSGAGRVGVGGSACPASQSLSRSAEERLCTVPLEDVLSTRERRARATIPNVVPRGAASACRCLVVTELRRLPGVNRKPLLAGGSDRLVVRATRDRSDAVVFVRDATPETSTSAASLKEIDETLKLGMPIFVLRAPTKSGESPPEPWPGPTSTSVAVERLPDERTTRRDCST